MDNRPLANILRFLPVVISPELRTRIPVGTRVLVEMIRVCALSELPPGTMRGVEQDGKRVLVVNLDGNLHAWDGTCSHEEADLSTGFLLGEEITCPLHLSRFNLLTGEAVNPPAEKPIGRRQVKVENGDVYVELDQ